MYIFKGKKNVLENIVPMLIEVTNTHVSIRWLYLLYDSCNNVRYIVEAQAGTTTIAIATLFDVLLKGITLTTFRKRTPFFTLRAHIKELLNDYDTELEDVLAADKQLATELQYDLRQFCQEQKLSKVAVEPLYLS